MVELGEILTGLVRRTAEGRLTWSRSVVSGRFTTSVDVISVVIEEARTYDGPTYILEILNESGLQVESLSWQDTNKEQEQEMARLYVLARRSALNIDSVLNKLAKDLDL